MPRTPSPAIRLAKPDVDHIRSKERQRVIKTLTLRSTPVAIRRAVGPSGPEIILRAAGAMVREADTTYREALPKRDELMLSLAFYGCVMNLAAAGDLTRRAFDAKRRAALKLAEKAEIPDGDAARAAAQAAGVKEIPQDQALRELPEVVEAIITADERKKAALVTRQNISLTLHDSYGWTDVMIAKDAAVSAGRVRDDLTQARERLQATDG